MIQSSKSTNTKSLLTAGWFLEKNAKMVSSQVFPLVFDILTVKTEGSSLQVGRVASQKLLFSKANCAAQGQRMKLVFEMLI